MGLLGNLLGGIGGGFGGGIGGGIRGMMQRRSSGGGGSSFSSAPATNKTQVNEPEPQEQAQQTEPQQAQPEPDKQPPQPQFAKQAAEDISKPVAQQKTETASPISGLLDEAPVSKPVDASGTQEEPVAPSVVNNAETMTPVSRPADEQAGQVPTLFQSDGILNQLMDSGSNRQPVEFQEGMPSRTPSIEDRSFQFQGPGSVSGALPARRYRARV